MSYLLRNYPQTPIPKKNRTNIFTARPSDEVMDWLVNVSLSKTATNNFIHNMKRSNLDRFCLILATGIYFLFVTTQEGDTCPSLKWVKLLKSFDVL